MRAVLFFIGICFHLVLGWELTITPHGERLLNNRVGENLIVVCTVKEFDGAASDVKIEWFRNGAQVSSFGRMMTIPRLYSNQLLLNKPQLSDKGLFLCKASIDGVEKELEAEISFVDPPKFIDPEVEQHPEEGSDAEIKCPVEGSENLEVFWQFNGQTLDISSPRGYDFKDDKQILIIPQYQSKKDDGLYNCNAAQFSSFETLTINVTGYSRPVITVFDTPEEGRGFEGLSAQLKCGAVGKPKPEYKWFTQDGHEIVTSDKYQVENGLLIIESLASDDAKLYKCLAVNAIGEDSKNFTLDVFLKPRVDHMVDITKKADETVDIVCRFRGEGNLKAKFTFGEQEYTVQDDKVSTEESETTNVDSNEIVQSLNDEETSFESDLGERAESIDDGYVSDEEEEEISRWKRFVDDVTSDRVIVREDDGSLILTIHQLSIDDAGTYTCLVENEAGVSERTMNVAITHPPTLKASSDDIVRSYSGNMVTIFCDVSAVPEPSWTWKKDGEEIEADGTSVVIDSTGESSRLTIETKKSYNFGRYTCEANNGIGKAEKIMNVIEISPPAVPYGIDCKQLIYPNYGKCTVPEGTYDEESTKPTDFEFLVSSIDDMDSSFEWDHARVVRVDYDITGMSIPQLLPNTQYLVRARAINEAGESELTEPVSMETTEPWAPDEPREVDMECDEFCTISWSTPNDHGSDITGYRVSVEELEENEFGVRVPVGNEWSIDVGADENSLQISHIRPDSYYKISVLAMNSIGRGSPRFIEVETDDKPLPISEGISRVKLLLAVGGGLVFLLCIIDFICFSVNRCGLLACFCLNCLGRNPSEAKEKDSEAARCESGRLLDNQPVSAR